MNWRESLQKNKVNAFFVPTELKMEKLVLRALKQAMAHIRSGCAEEMTANGKKKQRVLRSCEAVLPQWVRWGSWGFSGSLQQELPVAIFIICCRKAHGKEGLKVETDPTLYSCDHSDCDRNMLNFPSLIWSRVRKAHFMSKQGVRAGKQLKNAWAAKCGYLCYLLYNNYIVDQVLVALQKKKKSAMK